MAASVHGNVASQIGQQVESMILQAKKDSEARVRHELNLARTQLQNMEGLLGDLSERVARCVRANAPAGQDHSQTVDRAFLNSKIQQLEQKWGSEVKALKQDLHRTILAHNHNSDLMRHHRDALDEARRKLDSMTQPKAEQVDQQIDKVDRMLRHGQAKSKELETLAARLSQLEREVMELMPPAGGMAGPPGFGGMLPGMGGMGMLGQQSGAATGAPAPKRGGKKDASEEEMRLKLLQMEAAQAKAGSGFNAEAPVFIPTTATSEDAALGDAADAGTAGADADDAEGPGEGEGDEGPDDDSPDATTSAAAPAASAPAAEPAEAEEGAKEDTKEAGDEDAGDKDKEAGDKAASESPEAPAEPAS